jgi:hypothetical protein
MFCLAAKEHPDGFTTTRRSTPNGHPAAASNTCQG